MPEHVHLLMGEPPGDDLSRILQAVKISSAKRLPQKPFWARRYYDFNVFTTGKMSEKLGYMHQNPVSRELVKEPEEWKWSSHSFYQTGVQGLVQLNAENSFFSTSPRKKRGEIWGTHSEWYY